MNRSKRVAPRKSTVRAKRAATERAERTPEETLDICFDYFITEELLEELDEQGIDPRQLSNKMLERLRGRPLYVCIPVELADYIKSTSGVVPDGWGARNLSRRISELVAKGTVLEKMEKLGGAAR